MTFGDACSDAAARLIKDLSHYKGMDYCDPDLYPNKDILKALDALHYLVVRSDNWRPDGLTKDKKELMKLAKLCTRNALKSRCLCLD